MSSSHHRRVLSGIVGFSTALSVGFAMAGPAVAVEQYLPLPTYPSSQMRATTEGTADMATSIPHAMLNHGTDSVAPVGVNNWACKPSKQHPNPVVLVHGMSQTVYMTWSYLGPILHKLGYCVFAMNLPKAPNEGMSKAISAVSSFSFGALGSIMESVDYTAAFLNEVVRTTGAKQVDMIGYSEGGTVLNAMVHKYQHDMVDNIITLAGVNVGFDPAGLQEGKNLVWTKDGKLGPAGEKMASFDTAMVEMVLGSPVMNMATRGGHTVPGISYTNIISKYDEFQAVSTAANYAFQTAGPGATVNNIMLQDGCATDFSGHLSMPFNDRVLAMIFNTLAGMKVVEVPCVVSLPIIGNALVSDNAK